MSKLNDLVSELQNSFKAKTDQHQGHKYIQAEKDILDNEIQYFFGLVDSGVTLIWSSGKDKLYNYFNEPWLKFTGRNLEQEIGNGWMERIHPDDYECYFNTYTTAFEKHEKFDIDFRLHHASGEFRWIRVLGKPRYDNKSEFIGYIGHCFDINDRKITEELLIESEMRYRRLFESAKDGILILDAETGMILDVNPFLINLLGYTKEEFIQKAIWDIGIFNDILANKEKFLELQKNEYVRYEDLPLKTHFKCAINVEFVSNVYLVNGHKVIQCNIRDITRRKQTEEKLKYEQFLMRALIDSIPDHIYFKDCESRFIRINNAQAELFGLNDQAEAVGKTDFDFFSHEHAQNAFNDEREIIRTGFPISKEEKETWTDRPDSWVLTSKMPLFDIDKKIIGIIGISRNITQRKEMENILLEKNIEIESQNEEYLQLNEELIQTIAELNKAKEKAEESDKLKTAFLHNISHEIRTPMNAIVGFSGFLNDPALPPEKRQHFIDIIMQSSDQLLSIISDIVSIATIESGQERIIEKEIELNATLMFMYEQFLIKAKQQDICLTLKSFLPAQEVWIKTDETKLLQILTNLISNAFKFTKQGYVNFGSKIIDNELEFFIEDTGLGIASEMQKEIFKRFLQVENSTARQFGGSGLGLSISKAYVELLGGRIWLKSELGKGSTFYFTIPYIKGQKNILPEMQIGNNFKSKIKELKTLLIAEDEDSNFMLLQELLSDLPIHIIRATNGLEAIEICKTNKDIDLVLMDIKMPIMDGYEATKQIKGFMPNMPIIAQTAYFTDIDKSKALTCGCIDFISKPINRDLLFSKIEVQLTKSTYYN